MINLILTSSVLHLLPTLRRLTGFSVMTSAPNKDGKNIFPDGELYVRFPKVPRRGERTVVILAGSPKPNDRIVELEMTLSALMRGGVEGVEVFFTYFPYGMQDKIERAGEMNAAEALLAKLVEHHQVSRVYAIDPHFGRASWLTPFPFVPVSAHELLLSEARKRYPGAVFVAPDRGHEARTRELRGLKKTRMDSYTVTIEHNAAFLRVLADKVVGVVDDIIETGGTLVAFFEVCVKYKPKEIFAVATHGILPSGIERVRKAYGTLFLSNSVNQPAANVDISPLITRAL